MNKLTLTLLFLFFISCSSKPPYQWPKLMVEYFGELDKVTLVNDVLILRIDKNGIKKPAHQLSVLSSSSSLKAIETTLTQKGYIISKSSNSFRGGFIKSSQSEEIDSSTKIAPFIIDTTLLRGELSIEAFQTLHQSLFSKMDNSEKNLATNCLANIPKIKEICSVIQNQIKTRYLVINIFYGMQSPKQGKTLEIIGKRFLRSALSEDLHNASAAFKSYSFFIDLETTQVLWSKFYKSGSNELHGDAFMQYLYEVEIMNDLPGSPK